LPVAVRLRIDFADDTRQRWPDMIAEVRVDPQAVSEGAGRPLYEQTIRDLIRGKRRDNS